MSKQVFALNLIALFLHLAFISSQPAFSVCTLLQMCSIWLHMTLVLIGSSGNNCGSGTSCSLWGGAEMCKRRASKNMGCFMAWSMRFCLSWGTTRIWECSQLGWSLFKSRSLCDYPWISLRRGLRVSLDSCSSFILMCIGGLCVWFCYFVCFLPAVWMKRQCHGSQSVTENCPYQPAGTSASGVKIA